MTARDTVPEEIVDAIVDASRARNPETWTNWYDRDSDHWAETTYRHEGEPVMAPSAGGMPMMLCSDVEAFFGPLRTEAEHEAHLRDVNAKKRSEWEETRAEALHEAATKLRREAGAQAEAGAPEETYTSLIFAADLIDPTACGCVQHGDNENCVGPVQGLTPLPATA